MTSAITVEVFFLWSPFKIVMRIRALFLIFFTVVNSTSGYGQLLNNQSGEAFTDRPFFNETIVAKNAIKSIRGNFTHYKLGDAFRETALYRSYHFNRSGKLIKQFESRRIHGGIDTLVSIYEYDDAGNLSALRQRDEFGFYAYIYAYDSAGNVVREEYRRNLTKAASKGTKFEIGKEFIVTFETASYQYFDQQRKKTVYNSYDIPYKDVITYYNKDGQVTEEVERLRRTSGIKRTTYCYNGKGLLDSLKITSNRAGVQERIYVYEYDEFANLTNINYYKNGEHTTQHSIVYDDKTFLINNILVQNVATDFIRILRLEEYVFYDD